MEERKVGKKSFMTENDEMSVCVTEENSMNFGILFT